MECPNCPDVALVIAERQGVEIDYCPQCRGVWLDRGELDKLLERAADRGEKHMDPERSNPGRPYRDDDDDDRGRRRSRGKSWLSEIFD